jgi:tripartite-type tricarboxylate transporter receptor subunit TctC
MPSCRRLAIAALALAPWPSPVRRPLPRTASRAPHRRLCRGRPWTRAARLFAQALSKELGQPVIVENKTGANATLAGSEVVRAKPDGKTLWFAASPTITISPNVMKQMQFDPAKDLSALAPVLSYYNVLVINNNEPYKNTAELVSYAKAHPQNSAMARPAWAAPTISAPCCSPSAAASR